VICVDCNRPEATEAEWAIDHGNCDGCEWCESRCWGGTGCDARTLTRQELQASLAAYKRVVEAARFYYTHNQGGHGGDALRAALAALPEGA
jgi:hypothetical protein